MTLAMQQRENIEVTIANRTPQPGGGPETKRLLQHARVAHYFHLLEKAFGGVHSSVTAEHPLVALQGLFMRTGVSNELVWAEMAAIDQLLRIISMAKMAEQVEGWSDRPAVVVDKLPRALPLKKEASR